MKLIAPLIIVVTATAGFRHDSIATAEQVIAAIAQRTQWFEPQFVRTEEEMPAALSKESLQRAEAVMFVNTTGELPARDDLLSWVRGGGTFIGVHSASDTWHSSPDYIEMLGGEFESHPAEASVTIIVDDENHAATLGLESPHAIFEEIYSFRALATPTNHFLLHVDDGRPIAWYRSYGSGRVLYTALGHRVDVWTSQWFQQHLTGAIAWALRRDVSLRRRAVRH